MDFIRQTPTFSFCNRVLHVCAFEALSWLEPLHRILCVHRSNSPEEKARTSRTQRSSTYIHTSVLYARHSDDFGGRETSSRKGSALAHHETASSGTTATFARSKRQIHVSLHFIALHFRSGIASRLWLPEQGQQDQTFGKTLRKLRSCQDSWKAKTRGVSLGFPREPKLYMVAKLS